MDYINDKRIIKFKDDMNDTYDKNAVLHLVSGISIEELKRLKEVYKERKESNGKATAYKEAADDEIREGVIDHLLALINYR
tara:strand:- start:404 stop:646 length:243 start_codon:yes stop_codon:yes gene_type:complete